MEAQLIEVSPGAVEYLRTYVKKSKEWSWYSRSTFWTKKVKANSPAEASNASYKSWSQMASRGDIIQSVKWLLYQEQNQIAAEQKQANYDFSAAGCANDPRRKHYSAHCLEEFDTEGFEKEKYDVQQVSSSEEGVWTVSRESKTRIVVWVAGVDLKPTCTCGFMCNCGIPCRHVQAVAFKMGWDALEHIDSFYRSLT